MARDMMAKHELNGAIAIAGLITLGTPNLGYAYWPQTDDGQMCPQLVDDMAGSWLTGTDNLAPRYSSFLSTLTLNWGSASYGSFWLAAAGLACYNPARNGYQQVGCPISNQLSDCVVCADSASYQGTLSSQSPAPRPNTAWQDTELRYVHTDTLDGFGTLAIFGPNAPNAIALNKTQFGNRLFRTIVEVINGY